MQHTDKYKFNLIETSDAFGPEALNANTEAVEAVLDRMETEAAANFGTVGKNLRIEIGSYTGTGKAGLYNPSSITSELYPVVVIVGQEIYTGEGPMILLRPVEGSRFMSSYGSTVIWNDHTVSWFALNAQCQANLGGYIYHYVVLGY